MFSVNFLSRLFSRFLERRENNSWNRLAKAYPALNSIIKGAPRETECITMLPHCVAQELADTAKDKGNDRLQKMLKSGSADTRTCLYADKKGNVLKVYILAGEMISEIPPIKDHPDGIVTIEFDGTISVY